MEPTTQHPTSKLLIGPALSGKTRALRDIVVNLVQTHNVPQDQILLLCPTPHQAITLDISLNRELPDHLIHITTLAAWSLNLVRELEKDTPDHPEFTLYPKSMFSSLFAEIRSLNPRLTPAHYSNWLAKSHILSTHTLLEYVLTHLSHPVIQSKLPPYLVAFDIHHTDDAISLDLLHKMSEHRTCFFSIDPLDLPHDAKESTLILSQFEHLTPYTMPDFRAPKWVHDHLKPSFKRLSETPVASPEPDFIPFFHPETETISTLQWVKSALDTLNSQHGLSLDEIAILTHGQETELTAFLDSHGYPTRNLSEDHPLCHPQLQKIAGFLQCLYNPNDAAGHLALSDAEEKANVLANITLACNQNTPLSEWDAFKEPEILTEYRNALLTQKLPLPSIISGLMSQFQETESVPETDETAEVLEFLLELCDIYRHKLPHVLDHLHTTAIWEDTQQWTHDSHRKISIIPAQNSEALHTINPLTAILILGTKDEPISDRLRYRSLTQRCKFWGLASPHSSPSLGELHQQVPTPHYAPLVLNQAVQHPEWGQGKILKIEGEGPRQTVQIQFKNESKTIMRQFAPWL
jgi:hypothetical protein